MTTDNRIQNQFSSKQDIQSIPLEELTNFSLLLHNPHTYIIPSKKNPPTSHPFSNKHPAIFYTNLILWEPVLPSSTS